MEGLSRGYAMNGSGRDPVREHGQASMVRHSARALIAVIALLAAAGPASAASAGGGGPAASSETLFVVEIGVLLLVGRLMGEAAQRIGQPPVMGQLIGGLLLGPSVFGVIWPEAQHTLFPDSGAQKSMIDAISQLGILLLLLLTGMETDLQLVRRVGRAAVTVAIAGVALPFACGFALGEMLPAALLPKPDARFVTAIFLGTALSISSVKIVAMVVREMNFMRRDLGQIIVASAILEDTIGWVIIAVAFGLASAGTVDFWSLGRAVIGTALFMIASFTVGRRAVSSLIRWANDNFQSEFPVVTATLVIMCTMALTTQLLGVNTVLGAFIAGILVGESPILTRHIDEQIRGLIVALFMPVFFALSGLHADITILRNPGLALLACGLIVIASVGKFSGAFIGGKLGGLTRGESLALGCAMNARGSTEVIVASIGLTMGVLSQDLFTLIVTMAVVTTTAMPTMLRWALNRLPLRKKERVRLAREELDARGFVTNLERLLLAADDSANGKLAAQLIGAIAGSGDKPTTILDLTKGSKKVVDGKRVASDKLAMEKSNDKKPEGIANGFGSGKHSEHQVKTAAEATTTLDTHPDEEKSGSVDVITRQQKSVGPESVAGEARKGYDFLVVGIAKTHDPNGGFSKDVSLITKGFEGPLAIVDSHRSRADRPTERYDRILIPVNGTEVSRRAMEVGLTLARASDAQVTAFYVTRAGANGGRKRAQAARRNELAVLKDIGALADRYEVRVRSTTRANMAPDEAILRESKRGYDLIVLGVSRRPGDTLFFGNTAAAVLDRSETSNLFVAS
jgi:Kef-type K+ transport system membrane component KefB/nucleotide-binding universal stress UspA family protein